MTRYDADLSGLRVAAVRHVARRRGLRPSTESVRRLLAGGLSLEEVVRHPLVTDPAKENGLRGSTLYVGSTVLLLLVYVWATESEWWFWPLSAFGIVFAVLATEYASPELHARLEARYHSLMGLEGQLLLRLTMASLTVMLAILALMR